jgi:tetratricopeptide (TPR) repeat protein
MGLTWHYEENYSAAIPYLERAYDLDHFESDYGMVLASAYFGAHMQEKWEALYESLTIEHATNPEVWLDYSTSLYEIGESDKALDVIETGLLNNPQHSGLLYRLAALCYLSGQASAAIFVLEKALELNANEHIQLFTFAPELKKATAILACIAKYTQPRTGL